MNARVLIVEPDPALRGDLVRAARGAGYDAEGAEAPAAISRLSSRVDAIVLDVPDPRSLSLLDQLTEEADRTPVIAMAGRPALELAVEAMKRGARDFLRKPFSLPAFESALEAAVQPTPPARGAPRVVTQSPAVEDVLAQADAVAKSEATIQIVGESGTGKDLVARFVHARSARRNGPLVCLNCAALPETLADAELFGHEVGAFTGAVRARRGQARAAEGGTLLLEDVGEAASSVQAKLLRLLQEREVLPIGASRPERVDARFLVTSQRDLALEVACGRLRRDLYFRLDVVVLRIPPLRERTGDLPLLARTFLERFAAANGCETPHLGGAALAKLARHPFRGNVRELENLMRRAALLFPGREIDVDALLRRPAAPSPAAPATGTLNLRELERRAIERSLQQSGGNRTLASRALGISVRTLRNKIRRYGLV